MYYFPLCGCIYHYYYNKIYYSLIVQYSCQHNLDMAIRMLIALNCICLGNCGLAEPWTCILGPKGIHMQSNRNFWKKQGKLSSFIHVIRISCFYLKKKKAQFVVANKDEVLWPSFEKYNTQHDSCSRNIKLSVFAMK